MPDRPALSTVASSYDGSQSDAAGSEDLDLFSTPAEHTPLPNDHGKLRPTFNDVLSVVISNAASRLRSVGGSVGHLSKPTLQFLPVGAQVNAVVREWPSRNRGISDETFLHVVMHRNVSPRR